MPYAIQVAGELVTIDPALPFVTTQLRVAEDEAEHYEVATGTVIALELTHPSGALAAFGPDDLDRYQIVEVAMTLDAARSQQLSAAVAAYETRRQSSMSWDFGATEAKDDDGVSQGAAGVQQLQMRDAPGADDAKNWIAAASVASVMVVGGHSANVLPLKTAANLWVQTTAVQVLQVLATGDGTQAPAFARSLAMLERYGALKKQIADAADVAVVLAIDVTAGWPA